MQRVMYSIILRNQVCGQDNELHIFLVQINETRNQNLAKNVVVFWRGINKRIYLATSIAHVMQERTNDSVRYIQMLRPCIGQYFKLAMQAVGSPDRRVTARA